MRRITSTAWHTDETWYHQLLCLCRLSSAAIRFLQLDCASEACRLCQTCTRAYLTTRSLQKRAQRHLPLKQCLCLKVGHWCFQWYRWIVRCVDTWCPPHAMKSHRSLLRWFTLVFRYQKARLAAYLFECTPLKDLHLISTDIRSPSLHPIARKWARSSDGLSFHWSRLQNKPCRD